MQAVRRYIVVGVLLCVLVLLYVTTPPSAPAFVPAGLGGSLDQGRRYADGDASDADLHVSPRRRRRRASGSKRCRMESCFDFSLCAAGFRVYVYPSGGQRISPQYGQILDAVRHSQYHTRNASEACLFILAIDTLHRDHLSADYAPAVAAQVAALKWWRGGRNHVIFNLYAGTWPAYAEDEFGFDLGYAILAKASFSVSHYREGFDISLPLFHAGHPRRGGSPPAPTRPHKHFVLVFKGKRYLTGIGSETRNSLYHISNERDIILLTTCRHGNGWQHVADDRCHKDNFDYDRFDYKVLMLNSTFCLVPRGRRLGSFRFLEVLQAACIPVLLSNGWVLPFSEVIDWSKSAIWGDERLLLQIPSIIRSISEAGILRLRQQAEFLSEAYFSSIEKIVDTTFEIIKSRVYRRSWRSSLVWNTPPGALFVLPEYSADLSAYPFYWRHLGVSAESVRRLTAVVVTRAKTSVPPLSPLYRLVKNLGKSRFLVKVLVLCLAGDASLSNVRWPLPPSVTVIVRRIENLGGRFYPFADIETQAVLNLDENILLSTDEVDFGFHVWQHFPDRLVGSVARSHYWRDAERRWAYSSKPTNHFSMVAIGAAFYHSYYNHLYQRLLSPAVRSAIAETGECDDVAVNFLVAHATRRPPLKVTQRHLVAAAAAAEAGGGGAGSAAAAVAFLHRQQCMQLLDAAFGYMPLRRTAIRIDPLLFKDPVSITRKKYRMIEHV